MGEFRDQLRRYSVALISLAVAVASLGYNTWRNERTEANRNVRQAGVQMLLTLGDLDRVMFFSHFERNSDKGNPREGWAHALTIRDLSMLLPESGKSAANNLFSSWEENWEQVAEDRQVYEKVSNDIDDVRRSVLSILEELD